MSKLNIILTILTATFGTTTAGLATYEIVKEPVYVDVVKEVEVESKSLIDKYNALQEEVADLTNKLNESEALKQTYYNDLQKLNNEFNTLLGKYNRRDNCTCKTAPGGMGGYYPDEEY